LVKGKAVQFHPFRGEKGRVGQYITDPMRSMSTATLTKSDWPLPLDVLDAAVLATQSEITQLIVQHSADRGELVVTGNGVESRSGELNSLIESMSRVEDARDEEDEAMTEVRENLRIAGLENRLSAKELT
jgi:hypothetical protein